MHFCAGLHADIEPETGSHPATGAFGYRRVVVWMGLRGLNARFEANHRELRAIRRLRSFVGCVVHAQIERVHAQFPREIIQCRLHCVHGLGCPGGSISCNLRFVDHHVKSLDVEIFQIVRREHRHRTWSHGCTGKCSRLIGEPCGCGGDRAIFLRTHFHFAVRTGGRASCPENLFAGHHHLHGSSRFL